MAEKGGDYLTESASSKRKKTKVTNLCFSHSTS